MSTELLTILSGFISSILMGFLGIYGGKRWERRKIANEAKGSELNNVEEAIKIWRETAEELKNQIVDLKKKIDCLEKTIEDLKPFKDENKQLQKTINILRQQIECNKK